MSLFVKLRGWVLRHLVASAVATSAVVYLGYRVWAQQRQRAQLHQPLDPQNRVFDYIVIGSGSSGAVVANRLSEDPTVSVLLLEAGGDDDDDAEIAIPAAAANLQRKPHDWQFQTTSQAGTNHRVHNWPRGKVLGGCSSINWMIYVRGNPEDYDRMARLGCPGWSYEDVLPYFKKSENFLSAAPGDATFHGTKGELNVSTFDPSRPRHVSPNPLTQRWIKATSECGIPYNSDYNSGDQLGAAYFQTSTGGGLRYNTARAFIKPVLHRRNLTVRTHAHVTRILFRHKTAVGVAFRDTYPTNEQSTIMVAARREVVLSAGAVQSPQILMLSGVGPSAELKKAGIPLRGHLPGVGQNLQDHIMVGYGSECTQPISMDFDLLTTAPNFLQYLLWKGGPLRSQAVESTAFVKTRPGLSQPDVQFHFLCAGSHHEILTSNMNTGSVDPIDVKYGFSSFPTLLHPKSRGVIRLRSGNPLDAPVIEPRYLTHPDDVRSLVDGLKLARRIHHATAFDDVRGREIVDAEAAEDYDLDSDQYFEQVVRKSVVTVYHPVGTCKMGVDDLAVVDARCRVIGFRNLRVVDCSVMPEVPSGNTNAPAIMIGEKASEMIKQDWATGTHNIPGGSVLSRL